MLVCRMEKNENNKYRRLKDLFDKVVNDSQSIATDYSEEKKRMVLVNGIDLNYVHKWFPHATREEIEDSIVRYQTKVGVSNIFPIGYLESKKRPIQERYDQHYKEYCEQNKDQV